jgi:hypothetical protein
VTFQISRLGTSDMSFATAEQATSLRKIWEYLCIFTSLNL